SPRSGIVNVPEVTPLVGGMNGGTCISWWRSTRQVNAPGGSAPSSGSVAVPENVKLWPPRYNVPAAGAVIVPVGAALASTVSVAELLVTEPELLLTRTRKVAPLSPGAVV